MVEQIGCINHIHEPPSGDFPGANGCTEDHCTDKSGVFRAPHCPDCASDHGCGPDCPGYEEAA